MSTDINLSLNQEEGSKDIGLLQDPFNKESFDRIIMRIGKSWLSSKIEYKATIYFNKGATSGQHGIQGESFLDLTRKVEAFINGL